MEKKNNNRSLERIRVQLELLKQRLENMDEILCIQEDILNLVNENTETLLKTIPVTSENNLKVYDIMKKAFKKGKMPGILFK